MVGQFIICFVAPSLFTLIFVVAISSRCFPATFGMSTKVAAKPNKPCVEASVEGKVKMRQPKELMESYTDCLFYIHIIIYMY